MTVSTQVEASSASRRVLETEIFENIMKLKESEGDRGKEGKKPLADHAWSMPGMTAAVTQTTGSAIIKPTPAPLVETAVRQCAGAGDQPFS